MNIKYVFWGFCVLMAFPLTGIGRNLQDSAITARPIPYPVFQSKHFQQAVINQTRTEEGLPGKNYWTNKAAYRIRATLAPETKLLQASGELEYFNLSSDTLYQLVLKVRQNLHQEGAVRNRSVDITGGVTFTRVAVDGRVLLSRNRRYKSGYTIIGTVMYVDLKEPLFPGETAFLEFDWQFKVPEPKNPRMGQDGEVFFLGYWYPQFAVYDDVMGWDDEPYLGNGEFYMGFADYDVKLTVPEGWIVAATGQLQNPEEILTRDVVRRLEKAKESDKVVTVVDREDQFPGKSTLESENGLLTWHYIARNCRDFAFGASERFIWQAVRAKTNHNQNTLIQTFYRWGTSSWDKAALFGQFSAEYLSKHLSVYSYPQISIVEGIIPGGMEYPMITLIGGRRSEFTLFAVIFHEIAHLWFPMLVSSDEKTFTWMDEGLVSFYTNLGKDTYFKKFRSWSLELDRYIHFAKTGMEVEVSRHADRFPVYGLARRVAGYGKPAIMLRSLKAVIGEETFNKAIKDYIRSWQYKHPYPYDFFNIIEAHYGKDLDWFWTPFIYETWQLDQAITRVDETPTEITIAIEDKGLIPLPVFLRLTDSLNQHSFVRLPVDGWLSGKRHVEIMLQGSGYQRVDIDPERYFPDIDTTNNSWIKP